jgi:uncharacterized protein YjiS (DUF1127 family)
MFRQFEIVTHVAQLVVLRMRGGISMQKVALGWAGTGRSVTASAGEAAGTRLPRDFGVWAFPGINSAAVQAPRLLLALMRTWLKRHQSRQELLNYIAQDHRAAADMGSTRAKAEDWARRPFWRP